MTIDLHCHILPGVDDGPRDLEGASALAQAYVSAGIERVVATPHVNARWGSDAESRSTALDQLRRTLDEREIDLKVEAGGEVALATAVELDPGQLGEYRLAGGDWLLVEPPSSGPSVAIHSMIFEIQSRGHRVLLAHPERCQTFQEDLDLLDSLIHGGLRTQVTASALTGRFGTKAQRTAGQMFKRGLVHTIASDAHHATERPPGMTAELKRAGRADLTRWLCEEMPAWILDGGDEPKRPDGDASAKPGGLLRRLGRRS